MGLTLLGAPGSLLAKSFSLPFLALYVWGIVCGMRLLEGRPEAVRQNFWFWLVQLPYLMSPVAGYAFSSGASFHFTFQPDIGKWDFSARFGSNFVYSFLQTDKPLEFGLNIFALVVCGYLLWMMRRASATGQSGPTPLRGTP